VNLLDPKLGGKLRALLVILTAIVGVFSDPTIADLSWTPTVVKVLGGLVLIVEFLTHFTDVGTVPPAA
jgi:hypothetical protein